MFLKYDTRNGLDDILNNNLNSKVPSDVKLIVEGSGASTKYFIQRGADTASKKPLGSNGGSMLVENLNASAQSASVAWNTNTLPLLFRGGCPFSKITVESLSIDGCDHSSDPGCGENHGRGTFKVDVVEGNTTKTIYSTQSNLTNVTIHIPNPQTVTKLTVSISVVCHNNARHSIARGICFS